MKKTCTTVMGIMVVAWSAGVHGALARPLEPKRRLIHSFAKSGFADIMVVLIDYPSGPQCVVMAVRMDRSKTRRVVPISTRRFNRIWAAFQASGADKYPLGADAGWFDGNSNYFFVVGSQIYAVPKNKASAVLTSLATELRGYAK